MNFSTEQIAQKVALAQRYIKGRAIHETQQPILSSRDLEELQALVLFFQQAYYQHHHSWLKDEEFDSLFEYLKTQEEALHIPLEKRISIKIGNDKKSTHGLDIIKHAEFMLSLENAYNATDLYKFDEQVKKHIHQPTYIIEPKIDGLSLSLHYHHDKIVAAATRGNGEQGDNVLAQILATGCVPERLPLNALGIIKCEIRGEVYISKKNFLLLNQLLIDKNKSPLSNPRNAAAGGLRLKNMNEVKERRLSMLIYRLLIVDGDYPCNTHKENMEMLHSLSLSTSLPFIHLCCSMDDVIKKCEVLEQQRTHFPFEIDGLVIKVNSLTDQKILGETAHHPKWAVAFKMKAQSKESIINTVEFQVSRSGTITPVAKIEPVQIAGARINSVSLFNEDFIQEKGLKKGDHIIVERSGDVIPYISHVLYEKRRGSESSILYPKECPSCKEPLFKQDSQWKCLNKKCPEQVLGIIQHFVSKDALDIKGLGDQIIKTLVQKGVVISIVDLYTLPYETMKTWEGFGEKLVSNLEKAIEESKQTPMHRILYGLGIKYIGTTTAEKLVASIQHLLELTNYSIEKLQQTEDIGAKVAQSVLDYFADENNIRLLKQLESLGLALDIKPHNTNLLSQTFEGQSFLFTGTLAVCSREKAEHVIKQHGGRIASGVNKKLHILVAGENAGSKLQKAQQIAEIKILNEHDFLDLLSHYHIKI